MTLKLPTQEIDNNSLHVPPSVVVWPLQTVVVADATVLPQEFPADLTCSCHACDVSITITKSA